MSNLPPDPWKVLGIEKSADKSEIRTAYRKLVLKCHPDKVQDPTLKAQKQDEFQRVQQAYELLNDDTERAKYEEQVKLAEMRKAAMLSKNMPNISVSRTPPRSSHTFYEVRTAEPAARERSRHAPPHYSSPAPVPPPGKVYAHANASSRSYEDDLSPRSQTLYDEDRAARRAASYEQQPSRRDDEKREERKRREARSRKEEENRERDRERDRERERYEKEKRKQERRERDKIRDKEKRRDVRSKGVYVEEYDRDEVYPAAVKVEKKKVSLPSGSSKKADEPREKSASRRARDESPRMQQDKHDFRKLKEETAKEEAAAYIERHRAKAKAVPPLGRSQTFQEPPTYPRHVPSPPPAAAVYVDDDTVRRSSARSSRRASNDQGVRSQERLYSPSLKKSREDIEVIDTSPRAERVAPSRAAERIVPLLKKSNSTPPMVASVRPESPPRRPLRQNTAQEAHARPPPPMPSMTRASTFTQGVTHIIRGELESEDEGAHDDRRRYRSSRRTHSPERMTTRVYRAKAGSVTPIDTGYDDPYDHYEDRSTSRRHASSYREGTQYFYDAPPTAQFPRVKTSKYITPEDVQYSNIYPPNQGSWVAA